jgi:hypothetical protein
MNNLIAFTGEEAEVNLHHVYSMFEDQLLDPVALGGVPGHITANATQSLQASFDHNPFVCGFLAEVKTVKKLITTPYELDEDLSAVLSRLLFQYAKSYYGNELSRHGIDLDNQEAVLGAALEKYQPIIELKGNWELMIEKWVDLLAWRHLERLASREGGAVERQDCRFLGHGG